MSILAESGRIAVAEVIFSRTLHLAWGRGDGLWVSPPSESGAETDLVDEIGRRKPSEIKYVIPDAAGTIVLPEGSFSASENPTRHVYARFAFDYTEAVGEAVREIGLFSGAVVQPTLPTNQQYFTPSQIVTKGRLVFLKNYAPISRIPGAREWFEIVLSF